MISSNGTLVRTKGTLRMAVQKEGRLTRATLDLLDACGLDFDSYRNRLFAPCRNFPMTLLYGRDDDIPGYVASGAADLGIVGQNLLIENDVCERTVEIAKLGFGRCALVVAVSHDAPAHDVADLAGWRVATSYPNTVKRFFADKNITVQVVEVSGAVEMSPALGIADAIADLSATGSSLIQHDLRPIATILESEAVLVASPAALADKERAPIIERLTLRMRGVLEARRFKYVMMNAPAAKLEDICALVPGLRNPTVVPLKDPSWVAIHSVVEEVDFWEAIERLRSAGASEILVSPIEKLVKA